MSPARIPTIGKKCAGFSLIEIMLALLVVTIGVVSMAGLLGTTLGSTAKSHRELNGVGFADLVFNYCHSVTNWNAIPTTGIIMVPDYNFSDQSLQIGSLGRFDCLVPNAGANHQNIYTVSYLLHIEEIGNVKEMSLRIWPGYSTNAPPLIFYTELYNWVDK